MNRIIDNIDNTLLDSIMNRIYTNGVSFDGKIPVCKMDENGHYVLGNGGAWTDSFWVGVFYLAYAYTKEQKYLDIADKYQQFFKERVENDAQICKEKGYLPLDHDTGFIFSLSQVAKYKLTGDVEAREMALNAANILASRFRENGGYVLAWDTWPWDNDEQFIYEKKGKMIIDSMMNMPLLMWAYNETGDKRFEHIAITHAHTVREYIVRENGSSYHQFNFNPETGEPVKGVTGQGYYDESCWSRGQAWGIYGFALMYGYTKDIIFLETAIKLADYFVSQLDSSYIPIWDFDAKKIGYRPWDSSAGATAASGIIEISKHLADAEKAEKYLDAAKKMLSHLTEHCGAMNMDSYQPILLHSCIGPAYKKGAENSLLNSYSDTPTVYGDYFYVEALIKLANKNFDLFW